MAQIDEVRFYGYKHWTLEDVPRCFYVGKGLKKRPFSRNKGTRNHKWHAIVERYGLRVEICVGPLTSNEVFAWEIEWIAKENTYTTNHSHDDQSDIRCNLTRGGERSGGRIGKKRPDVSARMKFQFKNENFRRHISEAVRKAKKGKCRIHKYKMRNDKGKSHRYPQNSTPNHCSKCLKPGHDRRTCSSV